jgi:SAM-dependent methyltransferase
MIKTFSFYLPIISFIEEYIMFTQLHQITERPRAFEFYTVQSLWTDEHRAKQMLAHHLDGTVDISSRKFSFIERSVDWIVSYFHVTENTRIADFGCGPGLYSTRLAQKGGLVTGIDFSRNSLEYAQKQADKLSLEISFVNENYLAYETTETFDLIIMIMCDFCALSPVQRHKLLQKFHGFLEPGGHVLLDVYSPEAFGKKKEQTGYTHHPQGGFWSPRDHYEFYNSFTYEKEKVTLDKITIVEDAGTYTVYNWLQYFTQETLAGEFKAAGFSVKEYFSDVAGTPFSPDTGEFAIAAVKD